MRRFRLILVGGLAGVAVGCSGGGGDGGPPTITSVVVSGDSTVVLAGTRQLTATAMAGSTPVSTGVTFEWSSSNSTFVTVSPTGLVTGVVIPGSAGITARAVVNGTPTSVVSPAHVIRVRIGSIVLTPADTLRFTSLGDAIVLRGEARDALNQPITNGTRPIVFNTSDPQIVGLTGVNGAPPVDSISVIANGNGLAQVVASAQGESITDSAPVLVRQVATSLALTPDTVTFGRIDSVLTPNITATDARGNAIPASLLTWQSSNTAAATVNPTTGAITSKNEGQSRVIAMSGTLSDTVRVGVALVYNSIQIATTGATPVAIDSGVINRLNGTLQLGVIVRDAGNTIVPGPQGVAWSLHRGTIASVGASSGLVTGNDSTGRDTVVVAARGVRDSVPLVIRQVLATIAVTPASPQPLNFVGDTQSFAAEPRDSGGAAIAGQTISWATNNAVLSINSAGLATALQRTSASGVTVKIKATVNALTDSSRSIVVRQVPRFADLNPNSFGTLTAIGRSVQASCVVRDSASDTIPNHPCNWSALTPNVVSFSPATAKTTTITAAGNGSTTINATAATAVVGVNSVTVDQVAASVSLLPVNFGTPDVQMTISQRAPFIAVVRDSTNHIDPRTRSDVTWSVTPGTHASLSASPSETVTVTTNATTGSETVRATIGTVFGERIVAVAAAGVSFATGVQSVFTANCIGCHSGAGAPEGMSLASGVSYGLIVDVAAGEVAALKRVRPFLPDSSYLVHKIQGTQGTVGGSGARMPRGCSGGTCLPNATINIIRNWILQGALNN